MPSAQSADLDPHLLPTGGNRRARLRKREHRPGTARTADHQHAVVFRIEIQQRSPAQNRWIEILGSLQAAFLIQREEQIKRAARAHAGLGDVHHGGASNPVVGPQRCSLGV